jgi:GT2 family glycosyltransferase
MSLLRPLADSDRPSRSVGRAQPCADDPTVSVIVSCYSDARWNSLVHAIESVLAQSKPPLELLVVVDHEPRLRERLLSSFSDLPALQVLENRGRRGLSDARNTGVSRARGDVIAFLDDDASAERDWLEGLTSHYEDPRVIAVGGAVSPRWLAHRPSWFPPEFNWVIGCSYRGLPEQTESVRNLIGANMSFRREVFERLGGFRTDIGRIGTKPVGCEETEFCLRVQNAWPQGSIVYEPGATVVHEVTAHRGSWTYFFRRCYAEGLSKAVVARVAGGQRALSAERHYASRTLPSGFVQALRAAVTGFDPAAVGRAAAIVAGLATTTAGYIRGTALSARG